MILRKRKYIGSGEVEALDGTVEKFVLEVAVGLSYERLQKRWDDDDDDDEVVR